MTENKGQRNGNLLSSVALVSMLALAGCNSGGGDDTSPPPQDPVGGNSPPVISGTPPPSVVIGNEYSFTPTASDPDGDAITFSIEGQPDWASFDSGTGELSGTPQAGDEGPYDGISIAASDGNASDSLAFSVTVTQTGDRSVTLSWQAPTMNSDGSPLTNLAGYNIYYGVEPGDYTEEIHVENPGLTSYVVGNLSPDTWYFVATAFNSDNVESNYSGMAEVTIN